MMIQEGNQCPKCPTGILRATNERHPDGYVEYFCECTGCGAQLVNRQQAMWTDQSKELHDGSKP
jgi:hypothetical protein